METLQVENTGFGLTRKGGEKSLWRGVGGPFDGKYVIAEERFGHQEARPHGPPGSRRATSPGQTSRDGIRISGVVTRVAWVGAAIRAYVGESTGDAPRRGRGVVKRDAPLASYLPQPLPDAPMAICTAGKVGTVVVQVNEWVCTRAADRLLAFGIDEVSIDGQRHALLDLRRSCAGRHDHRADWALSLAAFQHAEERLWERFERGLSADAAGSLDFKAARSLAAECRTMVAEALAPEGVDTSAISTYRRLRFTHDGWSGTLDDLRRERCPQLAAAAERISRRASAYARIDPARQELFLTSPAGWYVRGGRAPTVDVRGQPPQ